MGNEIEGTDAIGVPTLFVRSATRQRIHAALETNDIKRVWFCKEYFREWNGYAVVEALCDRGYTCVIEVTESSCRHVPEILRARVQFYLKVDVPLKEGDYVCVGRAFKDESFRIGSGKTVNPQMYLQDRRLA